MREPRFLIFTLGCRVNKAESLQLEESLISQGWQKGEPPGLLVLNSCCVTQKAEKETRQTARALRRKYPGVFLVVTGCAVEKWRLEGRLKEMKRAIQADLLVDNRKKSQISNLLLCFLKGRHLQDISRQGRSKQGKKLRAFIKVQDGCNKFCSYCLVPFLRGKSRSKDPQKIIKEIKNLEIEGVKEIILCGIDLADYKYKLKIKNEKLKKFEIKNLSFLLKRILEETKVPRIRLGSINLEAFDDQFIALWSNPRLCPHFHIPLQSGCNQILKRMRRGYTFEQFKKIVEKLHQSIPKVNITTDVIVGFPEEREKEFEESLRNIASLKGLVGKLHIFRYSPRWGTLAASFDNQTDERVKICRAKKMEQLNQEIKEIFAKKFIGKTLSVLLEKEDEGLSENYLKVKVKRGLPAKIVDVKIKKAEKGVLYGEVVKRKGV
jgi:threonylcarbamoyladenosine tRNA methylthiotransferase MtaB